MENVSWEATHYGHHAETQDGRVLLDVVQDDQQLLWWCAVHVDGRVVLDCWSNDPGFMQQVLMRAWRSLV